MKQFSQRHLNPVCKPGIWATRRPRKSVVLLCREIDHFLKSLAQWKRIYVVKNLMATSLIFQIVYSEAQDTVSFLHLFALFVLHVHPRILHDFRNIAIQIDVELY